MMSNRGRKKAQNKTQTNKILGYFEQKNKYEGHTIAERILYDIVSESVVCPETVVCDILDGLLSTVQSTATTKNHDGNKVSKKTLTHWKARFPWLRVEDGEKEIRMTCQTCQRSKLNLTTVWANEGTPNIQISSLTRHSSSAEHQSACIALDKQKAKDAMMCENEDDDDDSMPFISNEDKIVFNTVYFTAKSELPSETINGLLGLQAKNGLDVKYKNLSWDSITDLQSSIAYVLTQQLVGEINSSPVFALMLDESTDVTVDKRLSICVRYIKAVEPKTQMLCNVAIDDGCAHTIVECVKNELDKKGINMAKCTSLATDGAAAMMGKHTGAGKQIQSKYSPFCTQTHCIAHRLNLACTATIKKNEYMIKFRDKFTALYFFMSGSSLSTLALRNIQQLLQEPELSIKEPHSIRWLGLRNAVAAVFESFASVLATLSKFAVEKNPVAKGLYKYFCSYKIALVIAFILDIHNELAVLSCAMQKRNLMFSEVGPLIEGTIGKISSLETVDGECLANMKDSTQKGGDEAYYCDEKLAYSKSMDAEFQTLRKDYVKRMKKNIKDRFKKEDSAIYDDLSKVMEPLTVNTTSDSECNEAMTHLAGFYGHEKTVKVVQGDLIEGTIQQDDVIAPLLDPVKLKEEWPRLHGMIKGTYSQLNSSTLCKRIILLHDAVMPNCAKLAAIALCIQPTSVECERSFSTQHRLKNKHRASIGSSQLNTLMIISMLGPDCASYDVSPAISHWLKKKREGGGDYLVHTNRGQLKNKSYVETSC